MLVLQRTLLPSTNIIFIANTDCFSFLLLSIAFNLNLQSILNSTTYEQTNSLANSSLSLLVAIVDLAPEVPEDLFHLMKKAVAIHKHLSFNRKDMDSKYRMVLIEARIHRLVRYYKTAGQLPPNFKYEADKASALVS